MEVVQGVPKLFDLSAKIAAVSVVNGLCNDSSAVSVEVRLSSGRARGALWTDLAVIVSSGCLGASGVEVVNLGALAALT